MGVPENNDPNAAARGGNDNRVSLPESYHTVAIPAGRPWRKMLAFAGPGFMVAVGYMDPGNWATDIAAGSSYNYLLLSVVLISSLMAMFLQGLAVKLGIATGRDLAQSCRDTFKPRTTIALWVLCEIAIAATDLAEVLGSAIALHLLFGIPIALGVCITALDVLVVLLLQHKGFRALESIVLTLIGTIAVCFALELYFAQPDWAAVGVGLVPSGRILADSRALYIAIGILGATVMPHNLYLHSSVVQTRNYEDKVESKREAIRYALIDSSFALTIAFFINASILVMAAATFYRAGHREVAEIGDAYKMLSPLLNVPAASALFGLALLASGQNSTLTGTLAGQIVMEGFLNLRLAPAVRRLITRLIAIVPAVIVTLIWGERGVTELLILSQVVLSLQLSFATFPLLFFTSDRAKMGEFAIGPLTRIIGWAVCVTIALLNVWLILKVAAEWVS
ncbi:MAG: Nramp family divalent metal transporter [Candidatus Sumerlaeia bacterium]